MRVSNHENIEATLKRVASLGQKFPEAKELLDFLKELIIYRNSVSAKLSEMEFDINQNEKPIFRISKLNCEKYIPYLKELTEILQEKGTEEIRNEAEKIHGKNPEEIKTLVIDTLHKKIENDVVRMIIYAWIQAILFPISKQIYVSEHEWFKPYCPVCGNLPFTSYISDTEEGEGIRFLKCSVCLNEWIYGRTQCVKCGNVEDPTLNYYIPEEYGYIEIQVCGKCNHYIKIFDKRKDGFVIPEVDDVATVTLDLWATEQGFKKVERNLLGL